MPLRLSPWALDAAYKGLPSGEETIAHAAIAAKKWNVLARDLMFPAAVLRQSALTHNSAWMRRFTELTKVQLCPHGKTTMSPELIALQLEDGAWGVTAATVGQVRLYRDFGVKRILLANQLLGRQEIDYIVSELHRAPDFDFYCLIDSPEGVALLENALAADSPPRPLQVLLELGMDGGRTGVRDNADALALAQRVKASAHLVLVGVEAFEGIVQGQPDGEAQVRALLDRILRVATECNARKLVRQPMILSAGGSSFFDLVASVLKTKTLRDARVVLRSGCYLVHDSAFYERLVEQLLARSPEARGLGEGLKPALEIWAQVHSRPEQKRIILGLGKRDCSFDAGYPTPLGWARAGENARRPLSGHVIQRLDDHHAYVDAPANSPLAVGDLVACGVSHPCTTFDRWRALYVVDDDLNVTSAVRTFF